MNYKLSLGVWGSVFAVPSCVADKLKIASESQLKVLLYILSKADYICPPENIAKDTGVPIGEVDDAVLFWQNMGVLDENGGELSPTSVDVPAVIPSPAPQPDRSAAVHNAAHSEIQFPPKEIASAVNGSKAVKYLFDTFERLSGRPTKHAERNALMTLIDDIGLPCEVAVMLVEYCFSIGKATPAYMRSVAEDWWKNEINTIGKAEERIKEIKKSYELENRLRRKFGLSSAFSSAQKKDIAEWAAFGMTDDMFDEAYDITMRNTGKFSFAYMNKVIRGWNAEGIKDVSQIRKKAPADMGKNSSFDIGDIAEWSVKKYSNLHNKKGGDGE